MELSFTVNSDEEGRELKNMLRFKLHLSMAMIRRLKADSGIFVNGKPVYTNHKVSEGEQVCVKLNDPAPDIPQEEGELDIVFEDEWYLVVNKRRGMISHPSRSRYSGTLLNIALHHVIENGGETVHAVNRLDRDTSGLILMAKSSYAKALFSHFQIEKVYMALVWGSPAKDEDVIDLPIKREAEREMRRIVAPDGDRAITKYRVEARYGEFSLLSIILETGRTHQIRVHSRAIGHPVLGDKLYGTEESLKLAEILDIEPHMLHACRLGFIHPITGKPILLNCPPDWKLVKNP